MKKFIVYLLTSLMTCSTFLTYAVSANEIDSEIVEDVINEEQTIEDNSEEFIYPDESDLDVVEGIEEEEIETEEWYHSKNTYFDFSNDNFYGSKNPLTAPSCTWFVWGRVKQMTGITLSGFIDKWVNSSYKGIGYTDTPSTYSIMMAYVGNTFVHTAFVEYWDGINIRISETNYGPSTEQYMYHEYYGTLEDFIKTYSKYNGWTSVKFIPLVEEPSYLADIKYNMDQASGTLAIAWKSGTLYNNDYFEVDIYDEEGNLYDVVQTTNSNVVYKVKDYGSYYFQILFVGNKPTESADYPFLYADPESYGFETDSNGVRFYHWDGYYLTNDWIKYNNDWYYFDDSGYMVTDWYKVDGLWYYFSETGVMAKGLTEIDGKYYYLNSDMKKGWQTIGADRYYFGTNGVAVNGWQKIDTVWYYFEDYKAVTGWKKIDGNWYYFNESYQMMKNGWLEYKDNWYYLDAAGVAVNGWQTINSKWYYFDNTKMVTGWKEIDGKLYCFNEKGVMMKSQWVEYNGTWAYLSTNGTALDGWQSINSKWYYFDKWQMCVGWKNIEDKWYFFDETGKMLTGWQKIKDKWYYLKNYAYDGFAKVDGAWYYFDNNAMTTATSKKIDGDTYYFNSDHTIKTGWILDGSQYRYADPSTARYLKLQWKKISNKWYYFNDAGFMMIGWIKINDSWYYTDTKGAMMSSTWLSYLGHWFYLGSNGVAVDGWQKIGTKWYYFDELKMTIGWLKINENWYCFNAKGVMMTGWILDNNEYYYLESNGVMATDKWINNTYYVLSNGRMARNQWIDGKYYVGNDGRYVPGMKK